MCPWVRRAEPRAEAAEDSAATVGTVSSVTGAEGLTAGGGGNCSGFNLSGRGDGRLLDSVKLIFRLASVAAGAAVAAGGLTTTATGGGATTTTGRCAAAAPAGALATTGPAGGLEAMAGVAGGAATMGGADRGWGTILRGAGRAGVAAGGAAAGALATEPDGPVRRALPWPSPQCRPMRAAHGPGAPLLLLSSWPGWP